MLLVDLWHRVAAERARLGPDDPLQEQLGRCFEACDDPEERCREALALAQAYRDYRWQQQGPTEWPPINRWLAEPEGGVEDFPYLPEGFAGADPQRARELVLAESWPPLSEEWQDHLGRAGPYRTPAVNLLWQDPSWEPALRSRLDASQAGWERFAARAELDEPLEELGRELMATLNTARGQFADLAALDNTWQELERLGDEFERVYPELSSPLCPHCGERGSWGQSSCPACGA